MALPQQNRLRSSRDFSKVYRKGKRAATQHLAVRAFRAKAFKAAISTVSSTKPQATELTQKQPKSVGGPPSALLLRSEIRPKQDFEQDTAQGPQFGISISRKVHKRAVVRNRIKRQIRAIIREHFLAIAPYWQIVIIVRQPAVECGFDEFLRELEYLLQKLAVIAR